MWSKPWKYKEGWVMGAGLLATGLFLQLAVGKIDINLFRFPVNLIFGAVFLFIIAGFHLLGRKFPVLRWFSTLEASITSLCFWLVLVVLMGFIRQGAPVEQFSGHWAERIGFHQMTLSWPFVLLLLYVLFILGQVTLRKIGGFHLKDMPFLLNHAGLFITLWAVFWGSGDLNRLRMQVQEGNMEWRASDDSGKLIELPLAIELKSFTIDEYPPKLMIIDDVTGEVLPEKQPVHLLVEETPFSDHLLDWDIEVTDYLPMAACVASADTVNFVGFQSEGATAALYVKARNREDGTGHEGWISSGNYMFPYVTLPLGKGKVLVMPEREPKRFASEIVVYTKDKQKAEALVEVNKPLTLAGWKIYQLSYDETMGKWSRSSVFELVRDPWLPVVYAGIVMLLAGSVCLFIFIPKKKEV